MSDRKFIVAALQMCATADVSHNLAVCKRLAAEAGTQGARLLVLPECFAFVGQNERDKLAIAERITGEAPKQIMQAIREIARDHSIWVIAGGMPEVPDRADVPNRTYNSCVAISPSGDVVAVYRKIHLFDVDIPGGAVLRESDSTAAGRDLSVVETELGILGLSICYDLRFPELYRHLVVHRGAEILVVPAAFTAHTGAAHWHTLLRSRAIENQCYVIAAAQYGRHNGRRESYGHSLIIDPWGSILAELPQGEGVICAEFDRDVLEKTRRQMPCLSHQVLMR